MIKLESLKKNIHFKLALKEKKVHTDFFSIFGAKNFISGKNKKVLHISFVMKKKNWKRCKKKQNKTQIESYSTQAFKKKGCN